MSLTDVASLPLAIALGVLAVIFVVAFTSALNRGHGRVAIALMLVAALFGGSAGFALSMTGVKNREARQQQTVIETQEAEQEAARVRTDIDAEIDAITAKAVRELERVNAEINQILQREADRLGVPVESIDPRITGDWSRWTYKASRQ